MRRTLFVFLAVLLLAAPASGSTITIDLIWSSTTGLGTIGSNQINAAPGDVLTLDILVTTAGPEGLSSLGLSPLFDADGKNELDFVSGTTIPFFLDENDNVVPWDIVFSPPLGGFFVESEPGQAGQAAQFGVGTLDDGPADDTFLLGEAVFEVNGSVESDGVDIVGGFLPGLDGAFDNLGDPVTVLSFGSASVNVPEPSTGLLLAAGLVGVAARRRRRAGNP